MKNNWILVLSVTLLTFCSSAQQVYESPYVYGGETIQIEIPEGLYLSDRTGGNAEMVFYFSDSTATMNDIIPEKLSVDYLMILHLKTKGKGLKEMMEKFERRLDLGDSDVKVTFTHKIETITREGREFAVMGVKGKMDELTAEHYYIAATIVGDYYIILNFCGPKKPAILDSFDEFLEFIDTFTLVHMEKENKLDVRIEETQEPEQVVEEPDQER